MSQAQIEITEGGKPVEVHYSKRFCPFLSLVSLNVPKSAVLAADGAPPSGPHLSGCRGMGCMFFVPALNEKGEIVNGSCAPIQLAQNGSSLVQLGAAAFERFLTNNNKRK